MTAAPPASDRASAGAHAAIGAAAGLASGLLGIGGGLIAVPLLTAWTDVPVKRAVGTSMVVVLITSALGVATEMIVRPANQHWDVALPLACGAVVGTLGGARIAARTAPRALSLMLAALLVVAAAKMAGLFSLLGDGPRVEHAPGAAVLLVAHAATGVLAGVLAAAFGIGGGILAVPVLAMLHPDWIFQACRATSLVMIVPTAAAGLVLHHRLAHVDPALAKRLGPAAALAAIAGVILANRVPGRPLEILFACVLIASAAKIAWKRG